MKLREIYSTNKTVISFEVFPPKSDTNNLLQEIKILEKYNPSFISLTYGAGGNENKSLELLKQIKNTGASIMPHFTCITSNKANIEIEIQHLSTLDVENILALRGDIPENFDIQNQDFKHANELVEFIKNNTNFSIGVAGYPEGHIESPDLDADIKFLKQKVDAGADVIFTQLFFDNNKYYDFIERIRKAGINVPVAAGIMPISSKKQITKMLSMAKISIPNNLRQQLTKYKGSDLIKFGIDFATEQCAELINNKVNGLHFFTLNKAHSTDKIINNIKGNL